MTPMPVNPVVVLLVDPITGVVMNDRNNIGNDLKIVTTHNQAEFIAKSAGVPYIAESEEIVSVGRQPLNGNAHKTKK